MAKLISYLEKEFATRNESCTLIIEPAIPSTFRNRTFFVRPDALILKDNVFCLIEMKGFGGDIIADCSRGAVWKSKEGEVIQPEGSLNPFSQVSRHRRALIEYLKDNYSLDDCAPIQARKIEKRMYQWLVEHIQSWVVTKEASRPILRGIYPHEFPYFRVIPLDRLPQNLMFIRAAPLLSSQEFERFLTSIEAKKVSKDEWYRSENIDYPEHPAGLIPKITFWIDAENRKNQLKALKYIQELELKQHRPHVVRCWSKSQFSDIRQESLLILIDWQDEKLGNILNEALQDKAYSIVNFSLEYLMTNGYPETVTTLENMLKTGPPEIYPKVVKAITSSGHPDSGKIIYDFAKNTLFNKPFQKFQHFEDIIKKYRLKKSREKHEELNRLLDERHRILNLTKEVINSLGDLYYKESIPWLIEIILKPSSLGFELDDYTELDLISYYDSIFEATCKALGKIREVPEYVATILLDRLTSSPEVFQWCIINLFGDLGETVAVPALLQYLKDPESRLYEITINALSKIRSEDSFDALAEAFLSHPFNYVSIIIGDALHKINQDKYIDILIGQIESLKINDEDKRDYLQALIPVVTLRCADTLFPLLKNNELSDLAAWNLSNLAENKYVFNRAMELTLSENPIEQAAAIWVLEKHFMENPYELARFDTIETHKIVRRAVATLYRLSKSKPRLYKYANDPDKAVRDCVFQSFQEGTFFGEHLIVSDSRKSSQCSIAVDEESLGIKLSNKVLIISKKNVVKASVTTDGKEKYGVYLVIKKGRNVTERILLVPIPNFLVTEKYLVDELSKNISGVSESDVIEMDDTLNELWLKITAYQGINKKS